MEYDRPQRRVRTKTRGEGCVGRLGAPTDALDSTITSASPVGTSAGTSIVTLWSSGNGDVHSVACMFVSQRFCQGCSLCASTMFVVTRPPGFAKRRCFSRYLVVVSVVSDTGAVDPQGGGKTQHPLARWGIKLTVEFSKHVCGAAGCVCVE